MPTRFLILAEGIKPQKATQRITALSRAAATAVRHPGREIHVYELHTSVRQEIESAPPNPPPTTR